MGRPRTKALPPGIYARPLAGGQANYWISFTDANGTRVQEKGGSTILDAQRLLTARRAEVAAGTFTRESGSSEQTLATYAARWTAFREKTGVRSAGLQAHILNTRVLPTMGGKPLSRITPRDVANLAVHLQATTTLSSKSILMAHGVLRALLSRARFEGLIASNPAADLPKGELPKLKPTRKVSAWTRAEVERWITPDAKVPPEHTVAYAVAAFTGARLGEVAGLRWQDLDTEARPLWRWSLRHQYDGAPLKTDNPRDIPIHAELQRILAAWKLEGWPLLMCRHPRPSDPVVPRILRRAKGDAVQGEHHRRSSLGVAALRRHARLVGINDTDRDFHSFRRAFITLARTDGASKDVVERVTHNAAGEVIDGYTYFGWEALCEAVTCVRVAPLRGVVALRRIQAAAGAPCYASGDAVECVGENASDSNVLQIPRIERSTQSSPASGPTSSRSTPRRTRASG